MAEVLAAAGSIVGVEGSIVVAAEDEESDLGMEPADLADFPPLPFSTGIS